MGMLLYSAALEMISINPRIFVLAFRDMLNNSANPTEQHVSYRRINERIYGVHYDQMNYDRTVVSEQTDGGVVDVVVRSDHAQIERSDVHLVLDADALGLLQVVQRVLHQLREVVRQVTMGHA